MPRSHVKNDNIRRQRYNRPHGPRKGGLWLNEGLRSNLTEIRNSRDLSTKVLANPWAIYYIIHPSSVEIMRFTLYS